VAKAFHAVWIDGLLYKLTFLNFPSYIVHTISYLRDRTFEASFQTATSSRVMQAGVAQGGLISSVFSLYVNMPSSMHHVELALYEATSRKPTLLVSYLESYFNDLQRWFSKWRIAISFQEHRDHLRACWTALHSNPTSNTLRGSNRMGRQNSLPGSNPRYTTHLVASHRSGKE
jgi:hypothetical protein